MLSSKSKSRSIQKVTVFESLSVCNALWPHGLLCPPGSFVYGMLQARILEWVTISRRWGPAWMALSAPLSVRHSTLPPPPHPVAPPACSVVTVWLWICTFWFLLFPQVCLFSTWKLANHSPSLAHPVSACVIHFPPSLSPCVDFHDLCCHEQSLQMNDFSTIEFWR